MLKKEFLKKSQLLKFVLKLFNFDKTYICALAEVKSIITSDAAFLFD